MPRAATPPLVLIILDGWGIAPPSRGNAIGLARTPVMNDLTRRFPHTTLAAAGSAVGLPPGQAGNSEAGHLNIGGGRLVVQDSIRITHAITEGAFFKNPAFLEALRTVQRRKSRLHLMGLVSADQSAHADPDHLLALLTLVRMKKIPRTYLHLFTDGRDTDPKRGLSLIQHLSRALTPSMHIASVIGRSYAMDRKKDWGRTAAAYHCLTRGDGLKAPDAFMAVSNAYERGETDEFIVPTVIAPFAKSGRIRANDVVIFFNLRSDRARQLTKAFVQPRFNALNPGSFHRKVVPRKLKFIAMTDFGPDLGDITTAFPSYDVKEALPLVWGDQPQLYVAESEKYAHITFFFNGGFDHPLAGERREVLPSPNLVHYETKPEMSAPQITERVLKELKSRRTPIIVLNFANADMIGHTGDLLATVRAIEVLDAQIGRIAQEVLAQQGTLIVTGDHGNAEEMVNKATGRVNPEHTANPVPLIIARPDLTATRNPLRDGGKLGDVAPTILHLQKRRIPGVMTGEVLWR